MSQPGLQVIAIHILSNISKSKDNQTKQFGQLIEYDKIILFFKNYAENESRRLVTDLILIFINVWYDVKSRPGHWVTMFNNMTIFLEIPL